jgi:hypothetical protein
VAVYVYGKKKHSNLLGEKMPVKGKFGKANVEDKLLQRDSDEKGMTFCPFYRDVCCAIQLQQPRFCGLAMTTGKGHNRQVVCSILQIAVSLSRLSFNSRFPTKS